MLVPKVSVLERVDCILKFIVNTPLNIHVNVSDIGMVFPNNGLSVLSLNGYLYSVQRK